MNNILLLLASIAVIILNNISRINDIIISKSNSVLQLLNAPTCFLIAIDKTSMYQSFIEGSLQGGNLDQKFMGQQLEY